MGAQATPVLAVHESWSHGFQTARAKSVQHCTNLGVRQHVTAHASETVTGLGTAQALRSVKVHQEHRRGVGILEKKASGTVFLRRNYTNGALMFEQFRQDSRQ